jgi:hypothetical protein
MLIFQYIKKFFLSSMHSSFDFIIPLYFKFEKQLSDHAVSWVKTSLLLISFLAAP